MCLPAYDDEITDSQAKVLYCGRSTVLCISITMFLILVVAIAATETAAWEDHQDWGVEEASAKHSFVCQKLAGGTCDSGWTAGNDSSKCWRLGDGTATFGGAQDRCAEEGGSLAIVASAAENEVVHRICGERQPCFIGLSRPSSQFEWAWVDESPLDYERWRTVDLDGKEVTPGYWEDEEEAAAVMGLLSVYPEEYYFLAVNLWGALANALTMGCVCCCFLQAMTSRSTCSLALGSCVDASCSCFCCCGLITSGLMVAAGLNFVSGVNLVLTVIQAGLLAFLSMHALQFRDRLKDAVTPATFPSRAVVEPTQFPMGHVVVGQPVFAGQVQPAAAQGLAADPELVGSESCRADR